jgi:DnaJ-class molecular chaperone
MAQIHTHYDNLKVTRNAPPEVIRAAYKTLSQKFHPDRNPDKQNATRTFQIINSAYEVLSDPVKRKEHDDWIAAAENQKRVLDTSPDFAYPSQPTQKKSMENIREMSRRAIHKKEFRKWAFQAAMTIDKSRINVRHAYKYFFWVALVTAIFIGILAA